MTAEKKEYDKRVVLISKEIAEGPCSHHSFIHLCIFSLYNYLSNNASRSPALHLRLGDIMKNKAGAVIRPHLVLSTYYFLVGVRREIPNIF